MAEDPRLYTNSPCKRGNRFVLLLSKVVTCVTEFVVYMYMHAIVVSFCSYTNTYEDY